VLCGGVSSLVGVNSLKVDTSLQKKGPDLVKQISLGAAGAAFNYALPCLSSKMSTGIGGLNVVVAALEMIQYCASSGTDSIMECIAALLEVVKTGLEVSESYHSTKEVCGKATAGMAACKGGWALHLAGWAGILHNAFSFIFKKDEDSQYYKDNPVECPAKYVEVMEILQILYSLGKIISLNNGMLKAGGIDPVAACDTLTLVGAVWIASDKIQNKNYLGQCGTNNHNAKIEVELRLEGIELAQHMALLAKGYFMVEAECKQEKHRYAQSAPADYEDAAQIKQSPRLSEALQTYDEHDFKELYGIKDV